MEAGARNGLRRTVGRLMVVTLLGLASSGCARVQSHFALPDLAMGDPAFGPTIEAYTATRVAGGNTVDLLLNGDEIFPAILDAIRSAQSTITYAQYFYEQGEMPEQIAAEDDLVYAQRIDPATWRERGAVDRLLEVLSLPVRREL